FQISKQFWSHLIKEEDITNPAEFIQSLPHISFVQGKKNKEFLSKRYEKLSTLPAFNKMNNTEDLDTNKNWIPLMMKDRALEEIASTKIDGGTDVNFGELAKKMMRFLEQDETVKVHYNSEVVSLKQHNQKQWEVKVKNDVLGSIAYYNADFLFIGAGGNAIPLLQKSKIRQSKNTGGFPISGEFLYCDNPEIVRKHHAKVYGKEALLFGPFAAFGPKFLKYGSNLDFFKHLKFNNVLTMAAAGMKNIPLIKYSIQQILMSKKDKIEELRKFYPNAKMEDWDVIVAGKRVQVIKDVSKFNRGVIHFGTEVVNSDDRTLSALLGESPGASISASVALEVLENNFATEFHGEWQAKFKKMIPSFGVDINEDVELLEKVWEKTNEYLGLN